MHEKKLLAFLLIAVGVAIGIGVLLRDSRVVRRVRNELIYRLPFRIPGIPSCPDCNIILVSLDTLRADELPCYGYMRDTAPNLCAFAKENILFLNFYSHSSFTLDSHMSIFTGLYPNTHHVLRALSDSLNPEIPTIAEILRNRGYTTIWAGITNDINLPIDRGMASGFSEIHELVPSGQDWQRGYEELLPELSGSRPVFMFLHTYAAHAPYLPGAGPRVYDRSNFPSIPVKEEDYFSHSPSFYQYVIGEFRRRMGLVGNTLESNKRLWELSQRIEDALQAGNLSQAESVMGGLPWYESYDLYIDWYYRHSVDRTNPRMVAYLRSLYDERIRMLDQELKPLFNAIQSPEIRRKTIVMFTADHGEEFMEHGELDHDANIYNTTTHVPFILSIPKIPSGVRRELSQSVDILPTLLDLVGIRRTKPVEGISLRPLLEGGALSLPGQRHLIGQHRGDAIVSIRNDRWKMYKNNTPEARFVELYDLLTDPSERYNVLGKHLDIARQLDTVLTGILDASPKYASVSGEFPVWVDEEKRKHLIEEGYF